MGYKTRAFFLLFIIVGIILTFRLSDRLPIPEKTSAKNEKNAFSGVLRLWIFEKNPIGAKNLSVWLNSESAKFEKKNDGIYIQITPVSEKTILNFAAAGVYSPDMIAVTPGILPDEDSLTDLSAIPVLTKTDNFPSSCLIPVASGGYAWAINREKVPDGILSGKFFG